MKYLFLVFIVCYCGIVEVAVNSTKDTVLEEQTDGKLRGTEGGASASGSAMGTVSLQYNYSSLL